MKRIIWCLFPFLLYLLVFPANALSGARAGLLLWYRSVLPVLFPFMLICSLLLRFHLLDRALPLLSRPFCFLFGCSRYGAFAILTGFLCGFPMGAKVTSDLLRQGRISRQEAYVLYGFVNNLSPSFILSFLAADQMRLPSWGGLFLLNILGPALLYGLISSRALRRESLAEGTLPEPAGQPSDLQGAFRTIDDCIYDTVLNTVRLGAYIVMFSLICSAVSLLLPTENPVLLFLTACIEVSNGVHLIAASPLPLSARYLMSTALGAFGGLSALAQSISIASMDRELSVRYIKSRVKITLLSALMSLGSVLFCGFFLSR